jgi:hypothetical protein
MEKFISDRKIVNRSFLRFLEHPLTNSSLPDKTLDRLC